MQHVEELIERIEAVREWMTPDDARLLAEKLRAAAADYSEGARRMRACADELAANDRSALQ